MFHGGQILLVATILLFVALFSTLLYQQEYAYWKVPSSNTTYLVCDKNGVAWWLYRYKFNENDNDIDDDDDDDDD